MTLPAKIAAMIQSSYETERQPVLFIVSCRLSAYTRRSERDVTSTSPGHRDDDALAGTDANTDAIPNSHSRRIALSLHH